MKPWSRPFPGLPFSDGHRIRLTPSKIFAGASLYLAIALGVTGFQFWQAENLVLPLGSIIGGDFVAFYAAAEAITQGATADIYTPEIFRKLLLEVGPPLEGYTLDWLYPPSYYFLVAPLSLTDYIPGYILWTGLGLLAFLFVLRGTGASKLTLYVVLASPGVYQAVITGQNGFLTATLLVLAALYPDKRPIVAGLAAALLTVKPHLGVLLPLAYLAGGMWRAFFVAALGTAALVTASVFVFGAGSWMAFHTEAGGAWAYLNQGLLPVHKMVTPLSALAFIGLPPKLALILHLMAALCTAAGVALIWSRVTDNGLRAAALCAGIFLVTPYGYFYELIVLALPLIIIVERGSRDGWLKFERLSLGLAYVLPMLMPGPPHQYGVSWGLLTVIVVATAVLRRINHDYPGALSMPLQRPNATN